MKQVIVSMLLFFVSCASFSQQRISARQIDQFNKNLKDNPLLKDDEDFKNSAVDKWPGESAVILCQKTMFDFDKKGISAGKRIGRNIWGALFAIPTFGASLYFANARNETKILVEETERRKILLRDKFALDQYSVLYFRLNAEGDAFAARVIKKDNSVQEVNIADAVKVEDVKSVPSVFRSYTDDRVGTYYRPIYFKIAIPDLEEGDIIEYEFKNFNTQSYSFNPNYKEFEPVYYVCNREMPVARQIIEVVTQDDKYFIGYRSLKGAPDFKQTSGSGKKVYRWVDDNREKLVDTRYVNEFVEQPSIKFQVIYARNSSKSFVWFKDEADMKRDLTSEDLADKVKMFWFNPSKLQTTGDYTSGLRSSIDNTVTSIYKSLKKKGVTDAAESDYVNKAYYSIRGQTLYSNWSDFAFAKVFSGLLAEKKIPHEVIVTTSNLRTQLNKVAFTQEIAWVIKYKGKYFCNPNEHLNPEEIPVHLAGNASIRFNFNDEKSSVADVIPLSDTASNILATQIEVKLDSSKVNLVIDKTVEAKGLVKDDIIDNVVALTPFMESDYRNYDGTSMWEGLSDAAATKAMEEFTKEKIEWKEEKPKMMKELAESEYDAKVEKYDNFRLQQDGRNIRKKFIRYNEDFTLSGLTAVAGPDIVVSLPVLIGSQPKISREERNRTVPVNVLYPRKLMWHIVMAVPEGYTVKGLEALNKELTNACGGFSSKATIEANNLVIDVKKMYIAPQFETAKWPLMLQILDAAYDFSQSKIVLKKN
jgi:hypothetical protein